MDSMLETLDRAIAQRMGEAHRLDPPASRELKDLMERYEADAARLRALAEAVGHQPIMYCAEKENPVTDHNRGTVRVCGWCAGCNLDRLLNEDREHDE